MPNNCVIALDELREIPVENISIHVLAMIKDAGGPVTDDLQVEPGREIQCNEMHETNSVEYSWKEALQ